MNLSTILLLAIANQVPDSLTRCDCAACRETARLFVAGLRTREATTIPLKPAPLSQGSVPKDATDDPPSPSPQTESATDGAANIRSHIASRNRHLSAETREQYVRWISQECSQRGVSLALIAALLSVESSFNAMARSPSGALGMAQLMPQTAADLGVTDPFDAQQSIRACVQLVASYLQKWEGNPQQKQLAVASYRLGYGAISAAGRVPEGTAAEFVERVLSLAAELAGK